MNKNSKGRMANHLKNKAKIQSRASGVPYHQVLNQLSKEAGYGSYNDFCKKNNTTKNEPAHVNVAKVKLPRPLVLTYHMLPARTERRPNGKMSVELHLEAGNYLKDLFAATEYNKRAQNAIGIVRHLLDDWVQCEYTDQTVLSDEVFFQMYYGNSKNPIFISPTDEYKAQLIKKCNRVSTIINTSYHHCQPVRFLCDELEQAIKFINAWPELKREAHKGVFKKRLIPGILVYLKDDPSPMVVFNHSFSNGVVTAYGHSGPATVARDEVAVYWDQSNAKVFKPMRLYLPYGKWICVDGSEVLYNRDYCPLWVKRPNGVVSEIDPDVWVDYVDDQHFFNANEAPWFGKQNNQKMETCQNVLRQWGVVDREPKLLKFFAQAIANNDTAVLRPKNMEKRFPIAV
jgi:hypothetical protein